MVRQQVTLYDAHLARIHLLLGRIESGLVNDRPMYLSQIRLIIDATDVGRAARAAITKEAKRQAYYDRARMAIPLGPSPLQGTKLTSSAVRRVTKRLKSMLQG